MGNSFKNTLNSMGTQVSASHARSVDNMIKPYLFFQKYNQKEVHEKVYNTCAWKGEML